MAAKRLLLLSISAGHGHVRAAGALKAGLERWFPQHDALFIDLATLAPWVFRKIYIDAYIRLVSSFPGIWGGIYNKFDRIDHDSVIEKARKSLESLCLKRLRKVLDEYRPDHLVCTHFMPEQVLLKWKKEGRIAQPVWTCITDFMAHSFWLEQGVEGYFIANSADVQNMRLRGLQESGIHVTGIPIFPSFIPAADKEAARKTAAEKFGLNPQRKTILLMGGGAGIGQMDKMAEELFSLPEDFQLVALAGKNLKLFSQLKEVQKNFPNRLLPLSFTTEVPTLLAMSDLVISKPGGLTSSECLAMGKPMLVHSPIPGQEENNAAYLTQNNAAMQADKEENIIGIVHDLLANPDKLENLAKNAAALGKPYAARDILEIILQEKSELE